MNLEKAEKEDLVGLLARLIILEDPATLLPDL
jgi:hypothetical protein